MTASPHTMRNVRRVVILALAAPVVALLAALTVHNPAAAATCKQWTGAVSTNWTAAGNWTPSGAPAPTDCVTIDNAVSVVNEPTIQNGTTVAVTNLTLDGHTLTVTGTGSLTLSAAGSALLSGTITGTGTVTVAGSMTWTSGLMSGTGSTVVANGGLLTIAPTVTSGYPILDTRTLTNNAGGTVSYTPVSTGYPWYFAGNTCAATSFVNNGTFTYAGPNTNDPGILSCGSPAITNGVSGTFTKTAGSAIAAVGPSLNNAGSVVATAGTLQLGGGSTSGTGNFTGTAPGKISLQAGTFNLGNGAGLAGVSVDGATVLVGTTGSPSGANVTLSGNNFFTAGSLDGNGVFTINGTLTWSAGAMVSTGTGTGSTVVASGGLLTIAPTVTSSYAILDTRTLTNNAGGTVNYTPVSTGYAWYFGGNTCNPTSFVNNGTFTYAGPNSSDPGVINCGAPVISNGATGTFTKSSGSAVSSVGPALRNGGSVTATAGTLQLAGDPTSAVGSFGAVSPAKVSLSSGTFILGNGSTFSGGVSVDGATVVVGTTGSPSGANVSIAGNNFLTAGGLDGNGVFTINGTLTWSAGAMASTGTGTGSTVVASGGLLTIAPTVTSSYAILDTRTLTNNSGGTVNYTPVSTGYSWYLGGNTCNPTSFVNNGTFTYAGPNSSDPGVIHCGTATITNGATGTFTKNSGSAVGAISPDFDNVGTLAVSAGTMQLTGAFPAYNGTNKLTKGTYVLTSPGILQFNAAAITNNGANLTLNGGAGALLQDTAGGNALANLNTNSGSLTVLNRTLTVKPFTNTGTVTVGPGASPSALVSTGAYTQNAGSTVLANATSTLQTGGTGNVSINAGTLSGIGKVQTPTATTFLSNAATVSPGSPASSTGTLAVTGGYKQTAAGALTINVAGSPGSGNFDKVTSTQAVTLNGVLNLDSTGYTRTLDDTFTILSTTTGGITGTFSSVTGTELGNSYFYEVVYNANSVQLVVHARDADVTLTTTSPNDVTADPTKPANDISWTLTVNNLGPAVATSVTLTDTLPAKVQITSITPSQGSCGAPNGSGVFSCSLGSIAPNPGVPPTIVILAKPLDPGTMTNQAAVTATQNDPAAGNNSVSDSVAVAAQSGVTYLDVTNSGFAAVSSKVALNKTIQYTILGTLTHHLTDTSGLIDSGNTGPRTFYRVKPQAAGKYVVSDTAVGGTHTINVAPTVKNNGNGTYTITWSVYATTPAGYGYDATVTGPLGTVTNLTPTRAEKSTIYTPTDGPGKYTVKVRIRNNTTHQGTSFASKKFTV